MTTSVSLIADGIGTMAGIQLDGLVLASQTINTAFETGSAYVEAFREEIGEIAANTTAFKTVSDRVDGITSAISDLKDKALEVFDTVVDGFAEAIPTAISGTASAIGGLLDKAGLGGVTDAVGGIVSFFQEVDKNAAE
jgi:phage-related protein